MESQDHSCQRNIYSRQIEKGEDRMEQVNPVLVRPADMRGIRKKETW